MVRRRGYPGRIRKSAGEISRMSMGNKNKRWKNAVVYQIYPKSFQDSDGDGIVIFQNYQQIGLFEKLWN